MSRPPFGQQLQSYRLDWLAVVLKLAQRDHKMDSPSKSAKDVCGERKSARLVIDLSTGA